MIADVSTGLVASKAALDMLKSLKDSLSSIKEVQQNSELMLQIGNLSIQFAETQQELAALILENSQLQSSLEGLKVENSRLKKPVKELRLRRDAYNLYYDKHDDQDGPYCTRCYEQDKLPVRLAERTRGPRIVEFGKFECPQCKQNYC